MSRGKKFTYQEVYDYFISQNCLLLSKKYINNHFKLDYKCKCGNISKITYNDFRKGSRCKKCVVESRKHTYQEVYDYFESQNCELLSKTYINSHTKLDYKCKCGNISNITFSSFKSGCRCPICGQNKKYTYQEVYEYFKSQNCELLSTEYINNKQYLDYICSCGNKAKITFKRFKQGQKCIKCGYDRLRLDNEKNNVWLSQSELTNYNIYKKNVKRLTNKTYKKYKNLINPLNLSRRKYHLDHKFSIIEGFKNSILPYIISKNNNLRLITKEENLSKGSNCSITYEELITNN